MAMSETLKFRLEREMLEHLQTIADREGRSLADVIRRILEAARAEALR